MNYKALTIAINSCIGMIEEAEPSRERSLVKTKLEEALLWAEQDKKRLK